MLCQDGAPRVRAHTYIHMTLSGFAGTDLDPPPLPRLPIDPAAISISGLSSGADFAVQFHVAFSETIMGLGVFAGQPFHCAATRFPGDPLLPANPQVPICDQCPPGKTIPYDHCKNVSRSFINVTMLADAARRMAAAGSIDDVSHLQRTKVYTHCGMADGSLVATQATHDFFLELVPAANGPASAD